MELGMIGLPAAAVDPTIASLAEGLQPGDTIIDGASSHYPDDIRRVGEGRWTFLAAIGSSTPVPVLGAALNQRFASREEVGFADRVLSAMRFQFGGHVEWPGGG